MKSRDHWGGVTTRYLNPQSHPLTIKKLLGKAAYSHQQCFMVSIYRLPVYEGSPRILFGLPDLFNGNIYTYQFLVTGCVVSTAGSSSFSAIPGCILTISVQSHPLLQKVTHLFPEHVVMTTDDVIPGIIDSNTQDGQSLVLLHDCLLNLF